jgi:adenylate cyclase
MAEIQIDGYQPELRAGIHWGRPRKLGGDYLGVDVNVAARVCDAAKAGQVLVSDPAVAMLPQNGLVLGRRKRLKADGTPRELGTTPVSRATA